MLHGLKMTKYMLNGKVRVLSVSLDATRGRKYLSLQCKNISALRKNMFDPNKLTFSCRVRTLARKGRQAYC